MSPTPISKMNNYQLIQQIKIRRALWDKNLWDKIDGNAREVMWEDVAEQMKSPREIVKARWKNLRDSYRKLLMKVAEKGENENSPRWRYFRDMDFIKDIVLNTKSKPSDISLKFSDESFSESAPDYGSFENLSDSNDPLSFPEVGASEVKVEKESSRPKRAEEQETDLEVFSEKMSSSYSTDDDFQFLMSLYPHFKQVPMNKKLLLRMKIEKLIHDEIYVQEEANCDFQM